MTVPGPHLRWTPSLFPALNLQVSAANKSKPNPPPGEHSPSSTLCLGPLSYYPSQPTCLQFLPIRTCQSQDTPHSPLCEIFYMCALLKLPSTKVYSNAKMQIVYHLLCDDCVISETDFPVFPRHTMHTFITAYSPTYYFLHAFLALKASRIRTHTLPSKEYILSKYF